LYAFQKAKSTNSRPFPRKLNTEGPTNVKNKEITPTIDSANEILELERQIITKFGSSAYKKFISDAEDMEGEDELDDDVEPKSSFRLKGKDESKLAVVPPAAVSNKEPLGEDEKPRTFSLIDRLRERKKLASGADIEKTRDASKDDIENISEYRFRKPIVSNVPTQPRIDVKPAKSMEQVQLERDQEKSKYKIFEFPVIEGKDVVNEFSRPFFSNKSFSDIGVSNYQALVNLRLMGLTSPTRIQEIALPVLKSVQNSIMHAQTG
jgi:hypothetical protein